MKKYCLGFAFNDHHVLLIKKIRPEWQKGFYNGIGGHIENNETPIAAMIREFKEECGIDTIELSWEEFCIMKGDDWICHCFKSKNVFDLRNAEQITDEEIKIINSYTLEKYPMITNLPFLVNLALDEHPPKFAEFNYSKK